MRHLFLYCNIYIPLYPKKAKYTFFYSSIKAKYQEFITDSFNGRRKERTKKGKYKKNDTYSKDMRNQQFTALSVQHPPQFVGTHVEHVIMPHDFSPAGITLPSLPETS